MTNTSYIVRAPKVSGAGTYVVSRHSTKQLAEKAARRGTSAFFVEEMAA